MEYLWVLEPEKGQIRKPRKAMCQREKEEGQSPAAMPSVIWVLNCYSWLLHLLHACKALQPLQPPPVIQSLTFILFLVHPQNLFPPRDCAKLFPHVFEWFTLSPHSVFYSNVTFAEWPHKITLSANTTTCTSFYSLICFFFRTLIGTLH